MAPANAKEFYQARLANFGTLMGHSPSLVSYLRNSSLTTLSGRDVTSIKNLRSLDTLLGGVGLSASFKQVKRNTLDSSFYFVATLHPVACNSGALCPHLHYSRRGSFWFGRVCM
jgi:hypothetical protein